MNRRKFIIGAGGAGAATIGLGLGADRIAASEDVEAGMFSVEDHEVDTNSGRLESLTIQDITVIAAFEGFDAPVMEVEWNLWVTHEGQTEHVGAANTELAGNQYEGNATSGMDDIDLVDVFGVTAFEVESGEDYEENAHEDHDVVFELEATVTDADDEEVTSDPMEGDSTIGVTNLGADVEVGGEGNVSTEDETGDAYPHEGTIEGTVYGQDGVSHWASPQDLTVYEAGDHDDPVVETVMDNNEGYSVTVPAGTYDIRVGPVSAWPDVEGWAMGVAVEPFETTVAPDIVTDEEV